MTAQGLAANLDHMRPSRARPSGRAFDLEGLAPLDEHEQALWRLREIPARERTLADYAPAFVDRGPGCWEWPGAQGNGYGMILMPDGRLRGAHRVAWELANGPIPDGLFVLHHCDNRACVRPDHLFLGTQGDNVRDMYAKGRGHGGPSKPLLPRPRSSIAGPNYRARSPRDEYRLARAVLMRRSGLKYREIGAALGVTGDRAWQLVREAERVRDERLRSVGHALRLLQ